MMFRMLTFLTVFVALVLPASAQSYRETPSFVEDVASGKLPAIGQRLPDEPQYHLPDSSPELPVSRVTAPVYLHQVVAL